MVVVVGGGGIRSVLRFYLADPRVLFSFNPQIAIIVERYHIYFGRVLSVERNFEEKRSANTSIMYEYGVAIIHFASKTCQWCN